MQLKIGAVAMDCNSAYKLDHEFVKIGLGVHIKLQLKLVIICQTEW